MEENRTEREPWVMDGEAEIPEGWSEEEWQDYQDYRDEQEYKRLVRAGMG